MKKNYVVLTVLLLLGLLFVPALVACGGGGTSNTSATTSAPETTAPAATETTTAQGEYDLEKILAGIKQDPSIPVPDKYKNSPVRVGSDAPYPPWEMFVGTSNQFTGFDYDLAQAIGAKLGVKFEFVKTAFDSIIIGIQAGNLDVAMSAMYDNKKRQEVLDFVNYAQDGTAIIVPKGNPNNIQTFEDLAGKHIGCEKGTTQADALTLLNERFKAEGKPEMIVSQFPDQPAVLLAVQSGKVICDLTDSSTGGYIARTSGGGEDFDIIMDPNPPEGWETQPDGIAVLKGNTELRDAIQAALQQLMDEGVYQIMVDYWGMLPWPSATINAGTGSGE